jgi:phosphoribosylglycinamide formyltransferase-1
VGSVLLGKWEGRMINLHPSLLPLFPGIDAIGQAWRAGVKETGVTVHFVDAGMDTGQLFLQQKVSVDPEDTAESLAAKIHLLEHQLLPKAIQKFQQEK